MPPEVPEHCPKCGIPNQVHDTGKHFHCKDCGAAWPKLKPEPKPKSKAGVTKGS